MATVYKIKCRMKTALLGFVEYYPERSQEETSFEQTVEDILHDQVSHVFMVDAYDIETGKSWDATMEIAKAVFNRTRDPVTRDLFDFLEENVGIIPAQSLKIESGLL